jgi:hypothetical protein
LALQGEEGDWELGITTPKGDFYPVVHFVAREDAEEAFAKVEKVLAKKRGAGPLIVKAVVGVIVAALLVTGCVVIFGLYVEHRVVSSSAIGPTSAAPPVVQEGVPLSADDVLKMPAE